MPVEVLESHCLENARKVVFFFSSSSSSSSSFSVLVFAGKCLDGRGKSGVTVRKEKANSERRHKKIKNILTVC